MAAKLCSILMQGGQGDVVMAVNGLQALRELGLPVLADGAVCYTRSVVEPLVRALLPDLNVARLADSRHCPHPRYATSAATSWSTVLRNWLGSDYYVNFAERRRRASFGYPAPGLARRAQQRLTDLKLAGGGSWRRESPVYYGLKIWAPLADAWGCSEIDLLRGLHLARPVLAGRLRDYAGEPGAALPPLAFFPGGGSFQYLPPAFIKSLVARLGLDNAQYACYFAPGERTAPAYAGLGLRCETTASMRELAGVVVHSRVTATADSFVSHIAQLAAPRHVALMSHDLPAHTLHPAAGSSVVYRPLPCCPCHYRTRLSSGDVCAAGHAACAALDAPGYLDAACDALADALRQEGVRHG